MLGGLGLNVKRLARIAYGGVDLGELRQGKWRFLTQHEIGQLFLAVEGDRRNVQRRTEKIERRKTTREERARRGGPTGAAGQRQDLRDGSNRKGRR